MSSTNENKSISLSGGSECREPADHAEAPGLAPDGVVSSSQPKQAKRLPKKAISKPNLSKAIGKLRESGTGESKIVIIEKVASEFVGSMEDLESKLRQNGIGSVTLAKFLG